MSPDIEWHVGDETGRETIARTRPAPASRWRRWLIAFAVMSGAGLGVLYTTLPEPPAPPAPTPTQTVTPLPPLEPVIAAEARALADGDRAAFMALQDEIDGEWYRAQAADFSAWGRPANADRLYGIASQIVLSDGRARARVSQWISNEEYVYQLRFYRLRDGAWKRARPDAAYWSGLRAAERTFHFEIAFPIEDRQTALRVTQRLERVYEVLCRDLNCDPRAGGADRITLDFRPDADAPRREWSLARTLSLPSPGLVGLYAPFGLADDVYTTFAYEALLEPIARLATGDNDRWARNPNGSLFFEAILAWQQLRIDLARDTPPERLVVEGPGGLTARPSQGDWEDTRRFYRDLLAGQRLIPPADLWVWPPNDRAVSNDLGDLAGGEVDALIAFIEERYGAASVIALLNALGPARSLEEAIETGLDADYDALIDEWLIWIER